MSDKELKTSGDPINSSREERLETCLIRLLNTTELNLDDMEEDTREAIREALGVLEVFQLPTIESDCSVETSETPAREFIDELHAVRDSVEELYLPSTISGTTETKCKTFWKNSWRKKKKSLRAAIVMLRRRRWLQRFKKDGRIFNTMMGLNGIILQFALIVEKNRWWDEEKNLVS